MPLSTLALWPQLAAIEDAAAVVEHVRENGTAEPIVWLTNNTYFPPLRAIGRANDFYSGSFWAPADAWLVYAETFEDAVESAGILLTAPEWDNALYAVDLRQWQYRDDADDAETLTDEWERVAQ